MAIKAMPRLSTLSEAARPIQLPVNPRPALASVDEPADIKSEHPEAVRSRARVVARRREKMTTLSHWIPIEAKFQFDHLLIDQKYVRKGLTGDDLLLEAINLLFRLYEKPAIARSEL